MKKTFSIFFVFIFSCCLLPAAYCLSEFDKLYLTNRPPRGDIYVVDIAGETFERKVLATTLQGVVNKKEARIYILDGEVGKVRPWEEEDERASTEFWLKYYQEKYGIKKKWGGKLDDALKIFANEIKGYYLASSLEPWTTDAATTLAALKGDSVVAFDSTKNLLDALKIQKKESLAGKWKDAASCYKDMYEIFYAKMPHKGFANLAPEEYRLRDFIIQQGIFTMYARPSMKEWDTVKSIIEKLPKNIPVFGYIALTGDEEVVAVQALSENGKYLIPTDTTPNFSFHVSVVPKTSLKSKQKAVKPPAKNPCDNDKLNVTVALSDGDNLVIPVTRYAWKTFWNSSERGKFPVGWSAGLSLGALAPAIADYYYSTATENDEWVAMLGIGYTQIYYYADRKFLLSKSYSRMSGLGLTTQWILDFPLSNPKARAWNDFSDYAVDGHPSGVLLGYGGPVFYRQFRTKKGMPVLVAINNYTDTTEMLAAQLRKLLELPPEKKPRLIFINATAWLNPYEKLVEILLPLEKEGVNFLKPSDALQCVP